MTRLAAKLQCVSNLGLMRQDNQDAMGVGAWYVAGGDKVAHKTEHPLGSPLPIVVSDGMGGHPGGDVASTIVVKELMGTQWQGDFRNVLRSALTRINDEMATTMARDPKLAGMGATVAGVVIDGRQLFHYNIGDSRVYLHSDGVLRQLSTDDRLNETHILTQVIGGFDSSPSMPPDLHTGVVPIAAGDAVLLCSDGLTGLVSDPAIEEALNSDSAGAADNLVASALDGGGYDNVTLIVARIVDSGSG